METKDKEIRDLIDDFKKHPEQFMFFLGAGFSSEIGLPVGKELADMLKKSFEEKGLLQKGADDTEEMELDSLISLLLNKRISRDVICAEIKRILEGKRNPATNISGEDFFGLFYKIITEAALSLDKSQTPGQICIATTNWDEALSEVFGDKAISIYSGNEVVKRKEIESKRIVIYQLHGSIKDCKSLLLTNEDKRQIKEKGGILWDSFKADADKRRIIFIGYSLSDEDILDVYFKARTGLENIKEKDFIIVNREESKEKIEERLSENNLQDIADVRVLNAFNFLIEMKESMGLVTGEETIELQTERKINEKLENGVIVAGYPLSGLTTLYLKYYSRLPDRKLSIERYKYNPYDKNSFTDIMNGLRKGQKVALFIPEYTFSVYLDEYLEEHQNELQTDLKKDIEKYYVVSHTVSKKEANEFLEKLIQKSKYKEKFDDDLKERILNLVKQTERDDFVIPRNTETYPLKLLKDVFERTQKRFANNEQPNKIKKDLDRKIEVKDDIEKLLDAGILLGMTQVGEEVPNLQRLIPQGLYKNVKQLLPSITYLLGITAPSALALVAVASIFLGIKEYLEHRGEKRTTQLDKYLQLKEYWDSLSDSEREMLCYKLDKKNKLKPGASEIYLNYIFMDRWEEVKKEVDEVKNKLDGFEDRLGDLEAKYPKIMESLNELSQVNDSIKLIKDEIESLKETIERLKEELYSTGAEKIINVRMLKDKLGVQDEDQNLIGLGNSENDSNVKEKINEIISNSKDHVCIIEGEAGSGKTTLLYMVGRSLLDRGSTLYYIVEPSNFSFQKFRNLDAYALYDIRDPKIANEILGEKLREAILNNTPLARVIISVRASYIKDSSFIELRGEEGFKSVYEAHVGYTESILQEIAIRRLRNSFPNLSQDDLDEASKKLAKKSEGLPLYIKEAVKMLEEKGFSLEFLDNLPYGVVYYNYKGNALLDSGRYEDAIEFFDMGIQLNPDDPGIHNNKGNALFKMKRYREAIEEYDKAIERDPNNPDYHYNKGIALSKLGKYEEAIEEYDKAIELNPKDPYYHYNKGNALLDSKRHQEAIEEYDKAIELNPKDPSFHNNKGNALNMLQRHQEAIEEYDKAIELNPNNPDYHKNKGLTLYMMQRYQEAIWEFDKAIELDPSNPEHHYNKGLAQEKLNQHSKKL